MQLKYDKYKYKNYDRQKSRVKRVVKLYARQLLQKVTNWQQLAYVYDRSIKPEYAEARIKKILRHREVQNMLTEEIAKLYEGIQLEGDYIVSLNGSALTSGVYFYSLQTNNFVDTKKLILLK